MGKRVVAMWSPSAKRSCMLLACSIILSLVLILSERVDVRLVGGVICRVERSLPRSRWSSVVVLCFVACRISSDHWASTGCRIGKRNRMDCGWSISHMVFVARCGGGRNRGMCMVALTPLWYKNA